MSKILTFLQTAARDLNDLNIPWALIGAMALSIHTEPRTTKDIDVAILFQDQNNQENFIEKLKQQGYTGESLLMQTSPTRRLGYRLEIPGSQIETLALDLLHSSSGIEPEIIAAATEIEIFPGVKIPVASRAHLLAMKILSQNEGDRIKDKVDIQNLMAGTSREEILEVKKALKLIEEREFHRGKDLQQELQEALKNYAPELS